MNTMLCEAAQQLYAYLYLDIVFIQHSTAEIGEVSMLEASCNAGIMSLCFTIHDQD